MSRNTFNPRVEDFIKDNKDLTVVGLYWAGYWRLTVCVVGVVIAIEFLSSLFN